MLQIGFTTRLSKNLLLLIDVAEVNDVGVDGRIVKMKQLEDQRLRIWIEL